MSILPSFEKKKKPTWLETKFTGYKEMDWLIYTNMFIYTYVNKQHP